MEAETNGKHSAIVNFALTMIPHALDARGVIHLPEWFTMGGIDDARAILSMVACIVEDLGPRVLRVDVPGRGQEKSDGVCIAEVAQQLAEGETIKCGRSGYAQEIDREALAAAAPRADTGIRLLYRSGQYVLAGSRREFDAQSRKRRTMPMSAARKAAMLRTKADYLILGGGIEGIAALAEARRIGIDAICLEARTKPGRRIRTERNRLMANYPVELGPKSSTAPR